MEVDSVDSPLSEHGKEKKPLISEQETDGFYGHVGIWGEEGEELIGI